MKRGKGMEWLEISCMSWQPLPQHTDSNSFPHVLFPEIESASPPRFFSFHNSAWIIAGSLYTSMPPTFSTFSSSRLPGPTDQVVDKRMMWLAEWPSNASPPYLSRMSGLIQHSPLFLVSHTVTHPSGAIETQIALCRTPTIVLMSRYVGI